MKANCFLNAAQRVIVRCADKTFYQMSASESQAWIADFLREVAGAGNPARHLKDGEVSDGHFTNAVATYTIQPYTTTGDSPMTHEILTPNEKLKRLRGIAKCLVDALGKVVLYDDDTAEGILEESETHAIDILDTIHDSDMKDVIDAVKIHFAAK